MQSRPLVIITTRLSPQICGVGAFSWLLHRHWPGHTAQQKFLVVDGAAESRAILGFSSISEFGSDWRTLGRALDEAGAVDILLHYTGRGYHRFGCPIGLPPVLQKWKSRFPDGRLLVFFHELPGPLPVTSRHYWFNLCNRRIVRKLANLAHSVITNTAEHARSLQKIASHHKVSWLPVPSNIEVHHAVQHERASSDFVIFGLPFSRWQTLLAFRSDINAWQENQILTRLHLIGPADQKFDARSDALINSLNWKDAVVRHGQLPPNQISQLLSRIRFALTTANESWSKSATLMAYMAHGCSVVTKSKIAEEPLCWAVAAGELGSISDTDLAGRAGRMRSWYETNADWKIVTTNVRNIIERLPLK